jgi:hypothetical protein
MSIDMPPFPHTEREKSDEMAKGGEMAERNIYDYT